MATMGILEATMTRDGTTHQRLWIDLVVTEVSWDVLIGPPGLLADPVSHFPEVALIPKRFLVVRIGG